MLKNYMATVILCKQGVSILNFRLKGGGYILDMTKPLNGPKTKPLFEPYTSWLKASFMLDKQGDGIL